MQHAHGYPSINEIIAAMSDAKLAETGAALRSDSMNEAIPQMMRKVIAKAADDIKAEQERRINASRSRDVTATKAAKSWQAPQQVVANQLTTPEQRYRL